MDHAVQSVSELPQDLQGIAAELHAKCAAAKFDLSEGDLAQILWEIARKYDVVSTVSQRREFCVSLKIEELVLARACAAGNERAWETFMLRYREKLYDMGLHVAREASAAHDLADSLYADLYGTLNKEGKRISKLSSYTGRGSLEGWLRTVMAQEHVNRFRRTKRTISLDEETEEGQQFAAAKPESSAPIDPRLEAATDEAISGLAAEDRFILAAYYLDGRTLAEIARMLSVHESTISRKVDKLAKSLRKQILAGLGRRGLSRRQAEEALEIDVRDMTLNIRDRLSQESARATFPEKKVEAPAGDGNG